MRQAKPSDAPKAHQNGQTISWRALRSGDGSRYSRRRFSVLQKPILGTTDGECWHRLGVRSFLLEILQTFMTATEALQYISTYAEGKLKDPEQRQEFWQRACYRLGKLRLQPNERRVD